MLLLGLALALSSVLGRDAVELTRVGAWPGYEKNLIWRLQLAGNGVFGADGEGLVVFDIADPENPRLVTRHALPGAPTEFRYHDGAVFVCMGEAGLAIVDVTNPEAPRTLSVHPVEGGARDLEVNGNVVFVQTGPGSRLNQGFIEAVDVEDRSNPSTLSRFGFGVLPGLSAEGGWLCVARWEGMELFDVADPANPQLVTTFDTPGYASDVVLSGGYAYVADDWLGFTIFDLRDPQKPILVANLGASYAQQVEVQGHRAFVYGEEGDRVAVYDISSPTHPIRLALLNEVRRPLTVAGNIGFSAYRGLRVYDITDPVQTSRIGIYPLGCDPWQVAVSGNTAFVANGDLGLALLDISDPANPREIAHHLLAPGDEFVHGVSVVGHYAYLSKWYVDGIEVVDVSDPTNPVSVATLPLDPLGPMLLTATRAYVPTTHDGVVVLDITDPSQPQEIGRSGDLVLPGGSNQLIYHPDELAVVEDHVVVKGFGEMPVLVLDCADASSIQVVTNLTPAWVAPSALDAQQDHVIVAGRHGVAIYDLSDPRMPVARSRAETNGIFSGVTWEGDYAYLTGYLSKEPLTVGPEGIAVLEVRNPATPRLVGSIETQDPPTGLTVSDGRLLVAYHGKVEILRSTELPQLTLERSGDGIRLTWKAEPGLVLQRSSALGSSQWDEVTLVAGTSEIIVADPGTPSFYRLQRNR
jgi:hypothetical protein